MPTPNAAALDALWNENDSSSQGGGLSNKERQPDGKDILAVVKEWKVVEGTYGPSLNIKVYYPGLAGNAKYWDTETIFLNFPDPNDENTKRRNARKGAIKDWVTRLELKVDGLSGVGTPTPSPIGYSVRLDKVTNGRFCNHYVRKLVEKAKPVETAPAKDGDVPF